jgi:hypothetical protein|tara:strand:+ start:348 stop:617 length:270 start_codon:yes stop_codon:yes gene_type:complete
MGVSFVLSVVLDLTNPRNRKGIIMKKATLDEHSNLYVSLRVAVKRKGCDLEYYEGSKEGERIKELINKRALQFIKVNWTRQQVKEKCDA